MESLSVRQARRLALARGGLLKPELTGLPVRAAGKGPRARARCLSIIDRFGYLQLDTVAVAGARTHSIVLASRLENFNASLGEELLTPGEPVVVMGPTGSPTEIPSGETAMLAGCGLGNAVLFSIGRAMPHAGNRVLFSARFKPLADLFKVPVLPHPPHLHVRRC